MKKFKAILALIPTVFLAISMIPNVFALGEIEVWVSYALEYSYYGSEVEAVSEAELAELTYSRYVIEVYVAVDEEFMQISYRTPWSNSLNWKDAARNIVERGDNYLYETFDANVQIIGWLTWDSDDSLLDYRDRLHELADELNWNARLRHNLVLVGFTGQAMFDENGQKVAGCAFNQEKNQTKALLINPQAYWADDNLFQHELSHILGLPDHYSNHHDCIMNNGKVYVSVIVEDGWMWPIFDYIPLCYVINYYCFDCAQKLINGLQYYKIRAEFPKWVGGGENFPI